MVKKKSVTDRSGMAGVACDLIKRGWTDEQIRVYISIDRKRLEKAKELFTRRKKYIKKYLKK